LEAEVMVEEVVGVPALLAEGVGWSEEEVELSMAEESSVLPDLSPG
jgi:hypothetical protein